MNARRVLAVLVAAVVAAAVTVSVGSAQTRVHRAGGTVSVLYAGSLVGVMEQQLGPAFSKATGYGYQGFGAGSKAVASQIKSKLKQGDVFISAAPAVNNSLYGASNGNWVTWYGTFASSPLVIGYSSSSRFASDFKTNKRWWNVLQSSGLLLGRTDPAIDPKGQLTIQFLHRVEVAKNLPGSRSASSAQPRTRRRSSPRRRSSGVWRQDSSTPASSTRSRPRSANLPTVHPPPARSTRQVHDHNPRQRPEPGRCAPRSSSTCSAARERDPTSRTASSSCSSDRPPESAPCRLSCANRRRSR